MNLVIMNSERYFINMFYSSLFYIISVSLFIYILLKKRHVDYFSLISLSSLYYFSPLFFKEINIFGFVYNVKINEMVYLYASIYFSLLIIFVLFFDLFFNEKKVVDITYSFADIPNFLYVISFLLFILGVYIVGLEFLLSPNKTDLASRNTVLYGLGLWLISCSALKAYVTKCHLLLSFSLVCIIFSLYVGSRSMFVMTILSIILVSFRTNGRKLRVVEQYREIIMVLLIVLLLVIFKVSYKSIKAGSFYSIISSFNDINLEDLLSLSLTDPNAVMYNLNYTINNNAFLGWDYLIHRVLSIFPLLSSLFSDIMGKDFGRYSSILGNDYDLHFGLASSIHGEIIAISGFMGFVIFSTLVMVSIFILNYYYLYKSTMWISLFVPFAIYNFFYSFRVDITFALGTIKSYFLILILMYFYRYIISSKLRKN